MVDPVSMALVGLATNPAVQAGAVDAIGELSPEAAAQRRAYDRAKKRLDTGVGYGFSQAQKNTMATQGNQAAASQLAAQQANLARQQAAGLVSGGGATQANRAIAQQAAAAAAQNAGAIQAESNAQARNQYAQDLARVDQQADIARQVWQRQSDRIYENPVSIPTGGDPAGADAVFGAGVDPANVKQAKAALAAKGP